MSKGLRHACLSSLIVYTIVHFVVDFSCAYLLFRLSLVEEIFERHVMALLGLYNVLAFGLESVIGVFFSQKTARVSATLGLLLLSCGLFLGMIVTNTVVSYEFGRDTSTIVAIMNNVVDVVPYSFGACFLAGVGNAFFHVGGGIDSLAFSFGKYWRSGVFISSGAIGLACGTLCGTNKIQFFSFGLVLAALGVSALSVWFFTHDDSLMSLEEKTTVSKRLFPLKQYGSCAISSNCSLFLSVFVPVLALLIVVSVRSAIGFLAPMLWEMKRLSAFSGITLAFAAFLGKFFGGYGADAVGARVFGVSSLILSAPLLCCSTFPFFFWLGIVLLNATTSITLLHVALFCNKRWGFAFGLTTLALLGGYYVYELFCRAMERTGVLETMPYMMAGALLVSSLFLMFSCKNVSSSSG